MSIKWNEIKVKPLAITNQIVIGKTKKLKSGMEIWTDKSDDMTNEILGAVVDHLLIELEKSDKDVVGYTWNTTDGEVLELSLKIRKE